MIKDDLTTMPSLNGLSHLDNKYTKRKCGFVTWLTGCIVVIQNELKIRRTMCPSTVGKANVNYSPKSLSHSKLNTNLTTI